MTSFDGSKYLADTLTHFISDVLPQPNIPVSILYCMYDNFMLKTLSLCMYVYVYMYVF